jgi:hypothetical protein
MVNEHDDEVDRSVEHLRRTTGDRSQGPDAVDPPPQGAAPRSAVPEDPAEGYDPAPEVPGGPQPDVPAGPGHAPPPQR